MKRLPIGIQTIEKIVREGYVYVDKTAYVRQLIEDGYPHYFMSRPRRFGKSLFLDTLRAILSGERELFVGCQIDESSYSWEAYPVLMFDFSLIANRSATEFEASLRRTLQEMGETFGLSIKAPTIQEGLLALITHLHSKQKKRVVVLVDEYDKPIIDTLHDLDVAQKNRDLMKDFYSALKSLDRYLKFTFVTGVSKFSQVSLFSGPNNLNDITMNPKYAGMMGYSEKELIASFDTYIHAIKERRGASISNSEIVDEIRTWYNGYRFSEGELCVYNPYSTLKYMHDKKPKAYWYSTGTPSFLIEELKKHSESMVSLDGTTATEEELMDISGFSQINLAALMYQTGYFSIKDYNPISKRFLLGLPNEEVRSAFINSLVQNFATIRKIKASEKFVKALEEHRPDFLFKHIEAGLASFAYQLFVDAKERTYQGMLLSMLYGMGFSPISERATNTGRIDVVLELPSTTYILELKLNGSSTKALEQIYEKQYFKAYTNKGKKIALIGANFSSKNRNISGWKGVLLSESGDKITDITPTGS